MRTRVNLNKFAPLGDNIRPHHPCKQGCGRRDEDMKDMSEFNQPHAG